MISTAIFSLWTAPPSWRVERGPLLIHTLAVSLARQWFREPGSLVLVTDNRGAEIAQLLGWRVSRITRALENCLPNDLAHIWALGKLIAIQSENRPCVHIDGDVLLGKQLPSWLLSADLFAQSPDPAIYYQSAAMEIGTKALQIPPVTSAYNCGLLGGRKILQFAADALSQAAKLRGIPIDGTTASMLIEQAGLASFARAGSIPVHTLFPAAAPSHAAADAAGYKHLLGAAKRDPVYLAAAELRLQTHYPAAYQSFLNGWKELQHTCTPHEVSARFDTGSVL